MPRHDICHEVVADALRREGWQVKSDIRRTHEDRIVYVDLHAAQANRARLIEVKCFPNLADTDEQYTAIGQYLIYQSLLRLEKATDPLYLAVPVTIYQDEFDDVILDTIQTHHIKLLVFDETGERRLQWIE